MTALHWPPCSSPLNPNLWHMTLGIKFSCQRLVEMDNEKTILKPCVLFLVHHARSVVTVWCSHRHLHKTEGYVWYVTLFSSCVEMKATVCCWLALGPWFWFRSPHILHSFHLWSLFFPTEDGGSRFLQSICKCSVPAGGTSDGRNVGILICQEEKYVTNKEPFWETILCKLVKYHK